MQFGVIGLGRMGANMVRRLLRAGDQCVVFDRSPQAVEALAKEMSSRPRSFRRVRLPISRAPSRGDGSGPRPSRLLGGV
jgi:6-phosphogluconate dehydrogenase (decarboxylating)